MRIIVVEDEEKLAKSLATGLAKHGFAVDIINNGQKAFDRISLNHIDYDLIILDLMLPDMDGTAITKSLRERNITTPILVLTAKNEIESKIDVLTLGADDYLVKPFSFGELLARIQVLLRRPVNALPSVLKVADIELDSTAQKVYREGEEIPLTLKEFVLLEYFMRNPGNVINREELLSHLWDFNYNSFSNVVDVHVKNLRKKLDPKNPERILQTIRGVGYRLKK